MVSSIMSQRKPAILIVILLMTPLLVTPAAAFYFEFQGLVTDKLVYEVGEVVNMAADLIADFGTSGWCYVSFALTGNEGPLHFEEYNITPSPAIRTFNSSGSILPDDISPGVSGIQVFAHFFAEIFDTVQQSDGDTIELTVLRGHLSLTPLTELTVPVGSNATIVVRLASAHSSSIVSTNADVAVMVTDTNSSIVLNTTTTTDNEGLLYIDWIDSMGPVGLYNLTIWGPGSEDFMPFGDSFSLEVIPAQSNITVIDAPSSVYCQSPNASHYDTADVTVCHEDLLGGSIEGSIVTWTTQFGFGEFLDEGNGYYFSSIPIHANPGPLAINVSAVNPAYQDVIQSIPMLVIPNPTLVVMQSESWNVTQGAEVRLNFTLQEYLSWNEAIVVEFQDSLGEIMIQSLVNPDMASSVLFFAEANTTPGVHRISAILPDFRYNLTEHCYFDLIILGTMNIELSEVHALYGGKLAFNIAALDTIDSIISNISYLIYCDGNPSSIATSLGLVNSTEYQEVNLPPFIEPGNHTFTFVFSSPYYTTAQVILDIAVWMETNISIIISESTSTHSLFLSSDYTKNLAWSNHETTTYLVDRNHFCLLPHSSSDLSYQLSKIEFWD